jgi:transcription termination/antitermination protein NusA
MNGEFIEALEQLQKEKDIPFSSLIATVEAAMSSAYRKHFGVAEEVRVEVDREAHTVRMFARKPIYAETPEEGEAAEGEAAEGVAVAIAPPLLAQGELTEEALDSAPIPIEYEEHEINLADFGRIAAQTAKQVVMQRIREAEREIVFDEFSHRVGEVVTAEVQRRDARSVYVALGRVEALLPAHEQIPGEPYRFNDRVKVYILDVRKTTKNPQIIVSRTHPKLVERLFELEVPEVYDGIVELKSVAREPGARSKVAVFSRDPQIDAVGACVGHRGARVQAIVDELRGEKIDIVRFSDTMEEYLKSALSPAKVSRVIVAPGNKSATVIAPDTQLSLAIGRRGQNVRLAAQLTGCHIDIRSESQVAEQPEIAAAIAAAAAPEVAEAPAAERIRVYELARELGVESRDLVEILQEEGVEVTSHASSVTGEQANMLREMLAGGAGTLEELEAGELPAE